MTESSAQRVAKMRADAYRSTLIETVHIAICETSRDDCLEYRGRCVKAVDALLRDGLVD